MYTQCPECMTIYQVDTATVAQAGGTVGCGHCGADFDVLRTLTEVLPDEPYDTLPVHANSPAPPILMLSVVHQAPPQQALFTAPTNEVDTEAALTDPHQAEPAPALPSFARKRPKRTRPHHHRRWVLACLLLALCLSVQLVWAERVPLTANAATRPWLQGICSVLGCALPPVRDVAKLQVLSRDVRPHPSVPDALLISTTIRNDAPFAQPYPVVSITLSDLDANRIAMRRFRPRDYLSDPTVRTRGLAPGATAALVFEVKDPGRNAVAFRFAFQ